MELITPNAVIFQTPGAGNLFQFLQQREIINFFFFALSDTDDFSRICTFANIIGKKNKKKIEYIVNEQCLLPFSHNVYNSVPKLYFRY